MEASRQDSKGPAGRGAIAKRNVAGAGASIAGVVRKLLGWMSGGGRAIELATITAIVGATLMIVAEFLDLYSIVGAAGATIGHVTCGSNHGYALLLFGLATLAGLTLARMTEQWLPALACCGLCLLAIAIVLVGDLPDASTSGLTRSRRIGDAQLAIGFWVELVATLLAFAGTGGIAYLLWRGNEPGEEPPPGSADEPRQPPGEGKRPPGKRSKRFQRTTDDKPTPESGEARSASRYQR